MNQKDALKPERRLKAWSLTIAAAGLLCILSIYIFREPVIGPYLNRFLVNRIQTQLGLRVSIGKISGTYFSNLELSDIRTLEQNPAGPVVALDAKQLRVDYSLPSLVLGMDGFISRLRADVSGAGIHLTLAPDGPKETPRPEDDQPAAIPLPDILPVIRIHDTSVFLQGKGYHLDLKGIDIMIRKAGEGSSAIDLEVAACQWVHPNIKNGTTSIRGALAYTRGILSAESLNLGKGLVVRSARIDMTGLPRSVSFDASLGAADGDVALHGQYDPESLNAQIHATNVSMSRLYSMIQAPYLLEEGTLSMRADAVIPWKHPEDLTLNMELDLRTPVMRGVRAERAALKGSAKDGEIFVQNLDLDMSGNTVAIRDLSVPMEPVLRKDLLDLAKKIGGTFFLRLEDIPALLKLAGFYTPPEDQTLPVHLLMLEGEMQTGKVTVSRGSFTAAGGKLDVDSLRVSLPMEGRGWTDLIVHTNINLDFPELGILGPLFGIGPLAGSLSGMISVDGAITSPKGKVAMTAKDLFYGGIPVGEAVIHASASQERLSIESVSLKKGNDWMKCNGAILVADRKIDDLQIEFSLTDVAPYILLVQKKYMKEGRNAPIISGSVNGKSFLNGPLNSPFGTLILNAKALTLQDRVMGDMDARIQRKDELIIVDMLELRNGEDRSVLKGSLNLQSGKMDNVTLSIALSDLDSYTRDLIPKAWAMSGKLFADVTASGPFSDPDGRILVKMADFKMGGVEVRNGLLEAWANNRQIHLKKVELGTSAGEIRMVGRLQQKSDSGTVEMSLDSFHFSQEGISLDLNEPGRISYTPRGDFVFKNISLRGEPDRLDIEGIFSQKGHSDLHVQITGLNGNGWLNNLIGDQLQLMGLDAQIHLSGSINSPAATVKGKVEKLTEKETSLSLYGQFDVGYDNTGFQIRQFEWRGEGGLKVMAKGSVPFVPTSKDPFQEGSLSIQVEAEIPNLKTLSPLLPGAPFQQGYLNLNLDLKGTWEQPVGSMRFTARGLDIPVNTKLFPPGPFNAEGDLSLENRKLSVRRFQLDSEALSMTAKGTWAGAPSLNQILRGKGVLVAGDLDMDSHLTSPDVGWILRETEGIRRAHGRLEAEVAVRGALPDPVITAKVRLSDGELRPELDIPSLRAINLAALVSAGGVQLESAHAELGGSQIQASGNVKRIQSEGNVLDFRLQGENLLIFRNEGMKVRADTDLAVRGPVSRMEISGNVEITDGRFSKRLDLLSMLRGSKKPRVDAAPGFFSLNTKPLSSAIFNIRMTAKNPFVIRNNLAKGEVRPELVLSGTGESLALAGEIYVNPTRISLPSGRLNIESGVIRLRKEDPNRPLLNLIGRALILGYDITVLVEGFYDEPKVTLSSVPPLPDEELLLLLLTGQPPKSQTGTRVGRGQRMKVAVFLGRELVSQWTGKDISEFDDAILERFEVEIGRGITRSGDETLEAQFRLAEGVMGKKNVIYITAEKDVFDAFNAGLRIVFRFK